LYTGACVLSARLARARESVNLPFEATGVTPQFPRLRRRSRRGTSQRRSAWTPHGNATHTGRKLHLWFTPQAKAARPARTAKTRDSAHNVPFRSTELRVRPTTFRPWHTRTGFPVRHPNNPTRGPAPRRPAACQREELRTTSSPTWQRRRHARDAAIPPVPQEEGQRRPDSQAGVHPGLIETRTSFEPSRGRHVFLYAARNLDPTGTRLEQPLLLR
jgi:hypothetical protein